MNKDIQVLIAKLNKVLVVINRGRYNLKKIRDEKDY